MKQLSVKVNNETTYIINENGTVIYKDGKEWKNGLLYEDGEDWEKYKAYFVKLIKIVGQYLRRVNLCLEINTKQNPKRILVLYLDSSEAHLVQGIKQSLMTCGEDIEKISAIKREDYIEVSIMDILFEY